MSAATCPEGAAAVGMPAGPEDSVSRYVDGEWNGEAPARSGQGIVGVYGPHYYSALEDESDDRMLTVVGARRLVETYGMVSRRDAARSRALLRPRLMDASAADLLLDSPYAPLWNLVATSAERGAFPRLVRLADPNVDLTLATRRVHELSPCGAQAIADRIAERIRETRDQLKTIEHDSLASREHRTLFGRLDTLVFAGHTLVVRGPDLAESLLALVRAGLSVDSVEAWLTGLSSTRVAVEMISSLFNDPGLAFGSHALNAIEGAQPRLRTATLALEIVGRHRQLVLNVLSGPYADMFAPELGQALFQLAESDGAAAGYINRRIVDEANGSQLLYDLGVRLAQDWSDDIESLLQVIRIVAGPRNDHSHLHFAV